MDGPIKPDDANRARINEVLAAVPPEITLLVRTESAVWSHMTIAGASGFAHQYSTGTQIESLQTLRERLREAAAYLTECIQSAEWKLANKDRIDQALQENGVGVFHGWVE